MTAQQAIAVIGAGSWGTALAVLLSRSDKPTWLWARNPEHVKLMQDERANQRYLPDVVLPDALVISDQLQEVISHSHDVLVVVPSHAFRATLQSIKPYLTLQHRLAWATKGFEPGSGKLMHEVAQDELGALTAMAVISGPTFAREVARGLPTAVTLAGRVAEEAHDLAAALSLETFRIYASGDVRGVELGGAVKNVLAIACGICDGKRLGDSANYSQHRLV